MPSPRTATEPSPDERVPAGEPRRGMLLMLLTLPIVVIAAVVVGGVIWSKNTPESTAPLALAAVPAPGGTGKYCSELSTALPAELGGLKRRTLVGEADGSAAWGDPAIILRCGLPTPAELDCSSKLIAISDANNVARVQWLQRSEGGQTTYLATDRPVRIALTLPDGTGTDAIQQLTSVISGVMKSTAQPDGTLCRAGTLPATDDR